MYLSIQATIDLAEMLVKWKKLGKPQTMSQGFLLLYEASYMKEELSNALIKMVGFRNALSHGYENIETEIFESVLSIHLSDIETFVDFVIQTENF